MQTRYICGLACKICLRDDTGVVARRNSSVLNKPSRKDRWPSSGSRANRREWVSTSVTRLMAAKSVSVNFRLTGGAQRRVPHTSFMAVISTVVRSATPTPSQRSRRTASPWPSCWKRRKSTRPTFDGTSKSSKCGSANGSVNVTLHPAKNGT